MVLTALRGALGFLSRLPVAHDTDAWDAFRSTPTAFPLAGYLIGGIALLPLLLPIPRPTVAIVFVVWLYVVTGITHLDGLADLADAAVTHGSPPDRRRVMTDTTVGVGAVLAVTVTVAGLVLAGFTIAALPRRGVLVVLAAEVGAKLAMATLAGLGSAAHDGLGSQFTTRATPRSLVLPVAVALPAAAVTVPSIAAGTALVTSLLVAVSLHYWATARLGGITGDVIGAGNELARLTALHAGVITWSITY